MSYIKITNSQFYEGLYAKRNMLVLGPSGWGKTATVERYARDNNLRIAYVDMAGQLPESIAGIPAIYEIKDDGLGVRRYYKRMLDVELKEFLESEGEGWVLFFDEINQGHPESLNTLYSITHPNPDMRRWAGYRLSKCQIVACGNLNDGRDGTVYLTELPTPLLNRFFVFELEPSIQDATEFLTKKWENIPMVGRYIKTMLEERITPRDVDLVLDVLHYKHDSMFLQAKLGPAITEKVLAIQKDLGELTRDPAELLKRARSVYKEFKSKGQLLFDGVTYTKEEDVLKKLSESLSEEELAAIVKGEE